MDIEHSATPTIAEFRAQIEMLNARIATDAVSYERDQDCIRELKDLLADARHTIEDWRNYASKLEGLTGPMPCGFARPD